MSDDKSVNLLTCREGYEDALAAESGAAIGRSPGCVVHRAVLPETPYIFERQRIGDAIEVPLEATKPLKPEMARQFLGEIIDQDTLWTSHAWSADPDQLSRVQGIERALLQQCKKLDTGTWKCWRKPEKLALRDTGWVLQLFRSEDTLWVGRCELTSLPDPFPGGIRRMKMDPEAPSRSYLKMEEALSYFGVEPEPGQRVVDLGAAPGGWSWSFLKRGCHVVAVDNGPMKIDNPRAFGGTLEHVRADGIGYCPLDPVDWLVSDMLIPPGQVIGMLRKWIEKRRAKCLVFNVKLPQQDAFAGLRPLKEYLELHTGNDIRLKQLYHDRREVTGFGILRD